MTSAWRRRLPVLVGVLLLAFAAWLVVGGGDATERDGASGAGGTTTRSAPDAATPSSGLPTVREGDLPEQARETLALIRAGGPYPYPQDDAPFGNREGLLPDRDRGYYREYTVETPGSPDRGARRVVAGADGDRYWTQDHYDSFAQIEEGS